MAALDMIKFYDIIASALLPAVAIYYLYVWVFHQDSSQKW